MYGSSTEQLAKRYRHLFVLPSFTVSFALVCISTIALVGLASFYQGAVATLLLITAAIISMTVSGLLVTWIVRRIDHSSLASARRFFGLLFVSTLVWIIPTFVGVLLSPALKGSITNEFIFGAFLAWGFELIVINGVFLRSTLQSLTISAFHPLPIALIVVSTTGFASLLSSLTGIVVLIMTIIFLSRIGAIKTKTGTASLTMLRAFLKTWVIREPAELEALFSGYAKGDSVETDVVIAEQSNKKIIIVIPGIHPGPFAPVGSYNLSELLYDGLKSPDVTPIILHGTGGHEKNVPTNKVAQDYVASISRFIQAQNNSQESTMRGPLRSTVGATSITSLAFGDQIIAFVSNSPYRSDDLDPDTVKDAFDAASELGFRTMIVDGHNSVDGKDPPQEDIPKERWSEIFRETLRLGEQELELGVANSSEIGFKTDIDISDGGISVLLLVTKTAKYALVSADSNNAQSGLKEKVDKGLRGIGIELLELCTSDTHKLAARNMTNRGYFALGERSDPKAIVDSVKKLAEIADSRSATYRLQIAEFGSEVPLIGEGSLDDFAELTKATIARAKLYSKVIVPVTLLLLVITLF